jgi:MYXO-CTERM domain-containing protein
MSWASWTREKLLPCCPMRRALIITLLSLALLPAALLSARTADACSCMAPPPPVVAAREASVVFHAKFVSAADMPKSGPHDLGYRMFTFDVLRTFKGQLDAQVKVKTTDNSAACGRDFGDPGSEWLIYARVDDQGQINDSLCSRTRPIADAAEDIQELEANAGSLDQPNEPTPTPVGAGEPEPEPLPLPVPDEEPAPVQPGKKGCSVSDSESAPLAAGGLALGLLGLLGWRARRRR